MANLIKSSIGKKVFMSLTGLFLIVFLVLHGTINFFSVIDSINGTFGRPDGLFMRGCEFMSLPIVTIMVPVLAAGFAIHILWALWLEIGNVRARGGFFRYQGGSKGKAESWASKNMIVLGIIIFGVLATHLLHFWQHMQLKMFLGQEEVNPYLLLVRTFGNPFITCVYLVWFVAIWLHLTHGVWSAFQTIGWSNTIWMKRLKWIGYIAATLIMSLFVAVAINSMVVSYTQPAVVKYLESTECCAECAEHHHECCGECGEAHKCCGEAEHKCSGNCADCAKNCGETAAVPCEGCCK